ncbi:YqzL family protein [Paenibacillus oenotherae]|uniref:YqzL family protein n=1 Tax=Paenibacillus oenotherae TaxID=1435645 RepID=A0ABS7D1A8_9BACL|nr:YqzL family protein [Paenibacillus oenotherae]MBW7473699.1 YqzL family protein [Paenibacillus oenotherae]
MRDFSWKYFALTGDVDAFLLYKEMDGLQTADSADEDEAAEAVSELEGI